jgi:nitroreductase
VQKRQTEERIGSRKFSSPAKAFRPEGNTMMTRRQANAGILVNAALAAAPVVVIAQELKPKDLPPPRGEGGRSLTAALKLRRSTREYSNRPLPTQVLSDLLWAAFGINRPESGGQTVPYWRHIMVIDVYLAMADGVWLYEPKTHKLLPYMKEDFRAQTGLQDFVATAPLNLVYVAHGGRMTDVTPEERRLYACADASFIGQNVYLFCASEGLATVFRGAVDGPKLGQHLRLPDQQFVTFAQTVGYPRG